MCNVELLQLGTDGSMFMAQAIHVTIIHKYVAADFALSTRAVRNNISKP